MPSEKLSPKPGAGRVTPKKRSPSGRAVRPPRPARPEKWQVDESRSVRNGWVWRGFLLLSVIALGVALILDGNHQGTLALAWVVIALGWFGVSMWLWRRHSRYMRR